MSRQVSQFVVEHLLVKHDARCDDLTNTQQWLYRTTPEPLLRNTYYDGTINEYQK